MVGDVGRCGADHSSQHGWAFKLDLKGVLRLASLNIGLGSASATSNQSTAPIGAVGSIVPCSEGGLGADVVTQVSDALPALSASVPSAAAVVTHEWTGDVVCGTVAVVVVHVGARGVVCCVRGVV